MVDEREDETDNLGSGISLDDSYKSGESEASENRKYHFRVLGVYNIKDRGKKVLVEILTSRNPKLKKGIKILLDTDDYELMRERKVYSDLDPDLEPEDVSGRTRSYSHEILDNIIGMAGSPEIVYYPKKSDSVVSSGELEDGEALEEKIA